MTASADPRSAAPLLAAEQLAVGHRGRALLPPLDLHVVPGEVVAVVGRNGSGKSTLFRTLLGLQPPVAGRVRRLRPGLNMSLIPQRQGLDPLLPVRAREVVGWGGLRGWGFWGPAPRRLRQAVDQALDDAGATALADRPMAELSEGERQRVIFARLLVANPDIAFLDEPTAAMDAVAERAAMADLRHLADAHGVAVVVVSHFVDLAAAVADRLVFLDPDGGHALAGPPADVLASPAFHERYRDLVSLGVAGAAGVEEAAGDRP